MPKLRNPTVTIHVTHNHVALHADYKPDDRCDYTIPAGFISDGASIPRWLWSTIGSPFFPQYLPAALYHDYLLEHVLPKRVAGYDKLKCDREFRRLLVANGVGRFRTNVMYRAVRAFGKASDPA